tara:strand:+ start:508 stop:1272 length:765 start_codon:yes stop_codon:yes gene_type:complete
VLFILFIILGAIWGSFANVCIYRLPNNLGVVVKSSFCPNCKNSIKWFDNIPLFSFFLLQGKCRNCKKTIDRQYIIVELLTAFSFATIYYFFGISITTLLLITLSVFFIIIFFIDLKHFIIPDSLTFSLMVIGFIKSFDPNLNQAIFPNYINSLIGGVTGYLIIWLIIYLYKLIRKKEGMGLGDAKLMAAIGFWFGWASLPFVIFFSSLVALIFAIPSLLKKSLAMSSEIPFGPYIIAACIFYLSFSNEIKNILY